MSLWIPPTTADEPEMSMYSWTAYEVQVAAFDEPTVHLAGYLGSSEGGRVTSAIESIDAGKRSVVTASGRVYQLVGRPGYNSDADYVWRRWLRLNDATLLRDATADFVERFAAAIADYGAEDRSGQPDIPPEEATESASQSGVPQADAAQLVRNGARRSPRRARIGGQASAGQGEQR